MKITILCVGKIKEKFYRDAIAEYEKRLSRYCKLEIIEVADEKTPDGASELVENQIKEKEAEWIKSRPAATVGNGSFPTMTKEQIMAITDRDERMRAIAQNQNLF